MRRETMYKGYSFYNFSRGHGRALEVTPPDGKKSVWCEDDTDHSTGRQADVRSPIEWTGEIGKFESATSTADEIIARIEAGKVKMAHKRDWFLSPLNKIPCANWRDEPIDEYGVKWGLIGPQTD
jgi:hypothetical protein